MIVRALLFILIVLVAFAGPWWLLPVPAILYAFRYPAYELFAVAFLLDLSYGTGAVAVPCVYLVTAALIVGAAEVLKPRLRFIA